MVRTSLTLLAALFLILPGAARAADAPPAGNWKVTIPNPEGSETPWIIQFANAGGKWTGSVLATADDAPKTTLEGLSITGERIRFTLQAGRQAYTFDSKLPKESTKIIKGSIARDGQMVPCELETTALTKLDTFELNKEFVANHPDDVRVFNAAMAVLSDAGDRKAKAEEVRGWAEKLYKAAEPYGLRWQQEMAVRAADILSPQEGYAPIALTYAQRAERLLEPKDPVRTKQRVLSALARALEKTGKTNEAKELNARVAKLEAEEDQEYLKKMPPFKVEPFSGRKGKSDRTVLVELFTGAQCAPCAAADAAFDGLAKTYKTTDVILLQYHVHIPGVDPLTNPDTTARLDYYSNEVDGTPTFLLNGTPGKAGPGSLSASQEVYQQYRKAIEALLDKPAQAALEVSAVHKGKKIEISAEAANVENPGENVRLRLALIEEQARYVGINGIRLHHHIVRAMPGGDRGFALKEKTTRHTASIDVDELRKQLTQYINTVAKKSGTRFPEAEQLVQLKDLRLVAFVQNDKTKEVLQAKQVELQGGKE